MVVEIWGALGRCASERFSSSTFRSIFTVFPLRYTHPRHPTARSKSDQVENTDFRGYGLTRGFWLQEPTTIRIVEAPSFTAMVQRTAGHPSTQLRAISQRLMSTPSKQLPYIVPYLANALISCKHQLSEPESPSKAKDGSDDAVLVHKFKTQLSALLQDKSVESRWAAIVLIKAMVEVGGWEILHGAGPWTRGLIGILGVCRYLFMQTLSTKPDYNRDMQCTDVMSPTEAGSCDYKETLYNYLDEDIPTYSRVSNTGQGDYHTIFARFYHFMFEQCQFTNIFARFPETKRP